MNKYYYTIGEVSNLLEVKPHVLRYWESEIPAIRPKKGGHQRRYSLEHIEILKKIKDMLYNQRFTIEGARQKLKQDKSIIAKIKTESKMIDVASSRTLDPMIGKSLHEIREQLVKLKQQCIKANRT